MLTSSGHSHSHGGGVLPQHVQEVSVDFSGGYELSPETKPRLKISAQLTKWLKAILSDTATRNLFLFLCLNLSFAFVELFYGMWTNSLGLISDSFHMFFDCTALLAGLVAALVAKWSSNERFSYGYVRAEVIAGFVNALFLLFISFFIFSEAIERAFEPPEVKHDRLLIISVAGFVVNLIGIFVFQHGGAGHGHSHGGGGSHGHSHGHAHSHDHAHSHGTNNHIHSHSHSHGSSDGSQLMHGIFLHILADTLGSVGVIISSTLIYLFDWMLADPLCSMFIAVLIMMSVYPLMNESLGVLMQRSPLKMDGILPQSLQRISDLEGVVEVRDAHFWTLCTGTYLGSMRLDIQEGADSTHLVAMARSTLKQAGVTDVIIEVTVID